MGHSAALLVFIPSTTKNVPGVTSCIVIIIFHFILFTIVFVLL